MSELDYDKYQKVQFKTQKQVKDVIAKAVKDACKDLVINEDIGATNIEVHDTDKLNTQIRVRTDYGVFYFNVKVSGS